jgi:diguanylate cyclase (GGDEF)-like protein
MRSTKDRLNEENVMERTILLVDDEEEIGAALARVLRHNGYTILRAKSGHEGLELLAQHEVGVVVSDQRMPEMTGVEFLSRVKELYPKTVRLILSGYADLNSVTDAINHGAVYKFLTKPWDNEMLCAHILDAFRLYERQQMNGRLAVEIQKTNVTMANLSLDLAKLVEQRDRQIEQLTYYDPLTNLPNRLLFLEKLNQGLVQAQNDNSLLALLFISLERSEQINDFFTNPEGDQFLKLVAGRLEKNTRQGDAVAYFGGDRFGFVLTNLKQATEASEIVQNILGTLTGSPILIEGLEIKISARSGTSIYPVDGIDSSELIKKAETALLN